MAANGESACRGRALETGCLSRTPSCRLRLNFVPRVLAIAAVLITAAASQSLNPVEEAASQFAEDGVNYTAVTETRWLFLPFITATSVKALALAGSQDDGVTTYVLYCPPSNTSCSLSPSLTFTEGFATAVYTTSRHTNTATLGCFFPTTPAVCTVRSSLTPEAQNAWENRATTLSASEFTSQAVEVTSLARLSTVTTASGPSASYYSAAASTARATSSVTLGAKAGIGVGTGFAGILIIAAVCMLYRRRRKRGAVDRQPYLDEKAELPGHRSPVPLPKKAELDQEAQVNEANGIAKPPEMDDKTTRAELDGSWHGHEAP